MHEQDRDAQVDRLLRSTLRHKDVQDAGTAGGSASVCLDEDTLAAWADGLLARRARAAAEAHAAGCARCQAVLAAMVRTTEPAAAAAGLKNESTAAAKIRQAFPWLVPLTAGAAALALWVAVRPAEKPVTSSPTASTFRERADQPSPVGRDSDMAKRAQNEARPSRAEEGKQEQQLRRKEAPSRSNAARDRRALEESRKADNPPRSVAEPQTVATARPEAAPAGPPSTEARPMVPPPASAAAAPGAAGQKAALADRLESAQSRRSASMESSLITPIPSSDPSSHWRIVSGSSVEQSTDGGRTWTPRRVDSAVTLLAGASPSANVCWVAGRAGTVLLTTDSTTWQKLAFPEPVDLVRVTAADARNASVTTIDARTFVTADGGQTWTLRE